MNPLLLTLIEAGFEIGAAHAGSEVGNVIKTSGMLIRAARAIDQLYDEEVGQPLDWSSLRHHDHLPPAGTAPEEPTPPPPPEEEVDGPILNKELETVEESNPEGDDPDES